MRTKAVLGAAVVAVTVALVALVATGTFTTHTKATVAPPSPNVATGRFPDESNTGVPKGTVLTPYIGPSAITKCGTVIDSKVVDGGLDVRAGNGTHSSATPCVTIENSVVNGAIDDRYTAVGFGPLLLIDDEINVPKSSQSPLYDIYETNWYGWRLNVHGGIGGLQCDGYCEIHDSFIHDFYYVSPNHVGAFLSNGAYGAPILLDHSTFLCRIINSADEDKSGGCTANVSFLGDNSPITNITVVNNLLKANAADEYYCAYTGAHQSTKKFPDGKDIVWKNNTFERGGGGKCGDTAPVYDWAYNPGNQWSGNRWDDGHTLEP